MQSYRNLKYRKVPIVVLGFNTGILRKREIRKVSVRFNLTLVSPPKFLWFHTFQEEFRRISFIPKYMYEIVLQDYNPLKALLCSSYMLFLCSSLLPMLFLCSSKALLCTFSSEMRARNWHATCYGVSNEATVQLHALNNPNSCVESSSSGTVVVVDE